MLKNMTLEFRWNRCKHINHIIIKMNTSNITKNPEATQ